MQLSQSVRLKQKQSLVMTPQLQQAIKLLQMTNLELQDYFEEQALENPFLEVDGKLKSEAAKSDDAQVSTTQEMPASLDQMKASEALGDDATQHSDFENRFSSEALQLGKSSGTQQIASSDWDMIESAVPNRADSLISHIMRQIDLTIMDAQDRFIAVTLMDGLAPSGWLDIPLSEVAIICGCTPEAVANVLKQVQQFEPTGIFARTLSECLTLQIEEAGCLTPVMQSVLDHLHLLGAGEIRQLSRKAGCDEAEILSCLQIIRNYNPKPAAEFDHEFITKHAPDVIVRETKSGWAIDLNRSTLPTVEIKEDYASSVVSRTRGGDKNAVKDYTGEAIGAAKWLKRTLEQRNATTLKIAAEVVRRQAQFFKKGLDGLQPLALRDVAEAIGMHESTISRVTSGLMISTPRGTFSMKSFFSVSIAASDDGEAKAAAAVRGLVKEIVSGEDPKRPLSDEVIARLVSRKGVKLARRTVAKYREMLRIPSSAERRRRAKLSMSG